MEDAVMQEQRRFAIQTLIFCFVFNATLLAACYVTGVRGFRLLHQWTDPLLTDEGQPALQDVQAALSNINALVEQTEHLFPVALLGLGGLMTLLLWLTVQFQGHRLIERISSRSGPSVPFPHEPSTKPRQKAALAARPVATQAIQMLAILQRQGRFVDFLQEDLRLYDDAQIGAAVRSVHEGCKKALSEHMVLKPVFEEEEEGGKVTVHPGFDAHSIRLTGDVAGDPPFQGTLRHRGWKVTRVDLPQQVSIPEGDWILAPAEVEVGG